MSLIAETTKVGEWADGWMDDDMTKISCPDIACFIYQHNIHHNI